MIGPEPCYLLPAWRSRILQKYWVVAILMIKQYLGALQLNNYFNQEDSYVYLGPPDKDHLSCSTNIVYNAGAAHVLKTTAYRGAGDLSKQL